MSASTAVTAAAATTVEHRHVSTPRREYVRACAPLPAMPCHAQQAMPSDRSEWDPAQEGHTPDAGLLQKVAGLQLFRLPGPIAPSHSALT